MDELRRKIFSVAGGRIRQLILFGSRAEGTACESSDLDVLVIERDPVDRRAESQRLRRELRDFPVPVDIHVMGELEFMETRDVIGGIAYPAAHHGIPLT